MRIHATLTIKVVYDEAESEDEIERMLNYATEHIASDGLLSGPSGAVVDTWEHTVETKEEK